jgi:hypothetical protein
VRLTFLALLAVVLAASPTASSGTPDGLAAPAKVQCGTERWDVKTLADASADEVNFTPKTTTVEALRSKHRPDIGSDDPRHAGVEQSTFKVKARLVEFKFEDDSDIHLVIAQPHDASETMIVEFPDPGCTRDSIERGAMRRARRNLLDACGQPPSASSSFADLRGRATVTGVGFFDLLHGQTGVAPNGIELHPVLRLAEATCRR